MKTTVKAAITILAVIAAGILFWRAAQIGMGTDKKTVAYETFQDLMLEAKNGFLDNFDSIQDATAILYDDVGLSVIASADGTPVLDDGNFTPVSEYLPQEKASALASVMGKYDSGTRVSGVEVTDKAVQFYCGYLDGGVYGFLYEKDLGNTTEYETIEITENWRLFYRLPDV